MYCLVETEKDLLQTVEDLHAYVDEVIAKGRKPRLALDTETFICAQSKAKYDLIYSLGLCRGKNLKAWATEMQEIVAKTVDVRTLDLTGAPEGFVLKEDPDLPVPEPWLNKDGYLDARVRLAQIGLDPKDCNLQYIIDFEKLHAEQGGDIFDLYIKVGNILRPLFDRVCFIGQSLKYEYKFFWAYFKLRLKLMRCTQLMSQIRFMGDKSNYKSHDLATQYGRAIPEDLFIEMVGMTHEQYRSFKKTEQKFWWGGALSDKEYKYSAEDVYCIWWVFEWLLQELSNWATMHGEGILWVVRLECELIKAAAKAEVRGMPFDPEIYHKDIEPLIQGKLDEAQAQIDVMYGMRRKEKREIKIRKKTTGKGKDKVIQTWEEEVVTVTEEPYKLAYFADIRELTGLSEAELEDTSADNLLFFIDKHPSIKWVIQYKEAQKARGYFSGTYGYLKMLDSNNRIHCSLHQIGQTENTVSSGRWSASGPNLTQVPNNFGIKAAFSVKKDRRLIVYDYSQIEPRILASEADDPILKTIFIKGKDLYAEVAKVVFKLAFLPIKGHQEAHWRQKAKVIFLALSYLMGIHKFMFTCFVDTKGELDYILQGEEGERRAREVLEGLEEMFPEVINLRKKTEEMVFALARHYGGLHKFTKAPYFVAKSKRGRTRCFCLKPEQKMDARKNPEEWAINLVVVNPKTGKTSTWANKSNEELRSAAREAGNNRIQSTAADVFKQAIVYYNEEEERLHDQGLIDEYTEGFILPVHDEIVCEASEEHAELIAGTVVKCMNRAWDEGEFGLPMEISGSYTKGDWLSSK